MNRIEPTCANNQWASGALHEAIGCAARADAAEMVLRGRDPATIDMAELTIAVEKEWLSRAIPAGNA